MKVKRRIRKLERKVARLTEQPRDLPPANTIRTTPIDTHTLWRDTTTDYAAYNDESYL